MYGTPSPNPGSTRSEDRAGTTALSVFVYKAQTMDRSPNPQIIKKYKKRNSKIGGR